MNILNLIIDGVEIPFESSHVITQNYVPLDAETVTRMSDGSAIKQTSWSGKTIIRTSGTGKLPLPISLIDYSASVVMDCVEPVEKFDLSNIITLPAARRSDISELGFSIVNGRAVKTSFSIVADVATLDIVSGASGYFMVYYPKFTVFISRPNEFDVSRSLNSRSWNFEAEEV